MATLIRLTIISIISSGLLLSVLAQAEDEIIRQAAEDYETGHYVQAIKQYEGLVNEGYQSFALYFNLGNAYYETGQIGKALVNYLRAELLYPRDSDLDRNIARVRVERVTFQRDEHNLLNRAASMTSSSMTMDEVGALGLITWGLFFVALSIHIIRKNWRRYLLFVLIPLGIIAGITNSFLFARVYATNRRPAAVVTRLTAPVYSGPGPEYLPIYDLHMATELRVLEQKGVWIRFILPDGRQGWVNVAAVEKV